MIPRWLKHAFEVPRQEVAIPTPAQNEIVEFLCKEIVRRHLTVPALAFLEMSRPLNFLSAQAMHFFAPIVSAMANAQAYGHLATFLENRGSIEYLCRRIEALEQECRRRESPPEAAPPPDDIQPP